jgi:hypothetical protein
MSVNYKRLTSIKLSQAYLEELITRLDFMRFQEIISIFPQGNSKRLPLYSAKRLGVLQEPSKFFPKLTKHGAYSILMHRLRTPSFFQNNYHQVETDESIVWYLFDYHEPYKFLKNLSPDGISYLRKMLPAYLSEIPVPPLYYLWKIFRGGGFRSNNSDHLRDAILGDRLAFCEDCYSNSISPDLFKVSDTQEPLYLGPVGREELSARSEAYPEETLDFCLLLALDIAVHFPDDPCKLRALGENINSILSMSLTVNGETVTVFEAIAFLTWTKKFENQKVLGTTIAEWFWQSWCSSFPSSSLYSSYGAENVSPQVERHQNLDNTLFGVVAKWDDQSGLTTNARMTLNAVRSAGRSVVEFFPDARMVKSEGQQAMPKNLDLVIHLNADEAVEIVFSFLSRAFDFRIASISGFYLWELGEIPAAHELGVSLVDKVLAPTDFVKKAYEKYSESIEIFNVGKAVSVPVSNEVPNELNGLDPSSYAFLSIFDYNSGIERKNPYALVRAYLDAFREEEGAHLIIKAGPMVKNHWGDPFSTYKKIKDVIADRSDITMITRRITDEELFGLIRSVACVVSPHRGEGFGYLSAYALLLNKPLIVTGYSGLDSWQLDGDGIALVDYEMKPTPQGKFFHDARNFKWADISHEKLVSTLRNFYTSNIRKSSPPSDVGDYYTSESYYSRLYKLIT